VRTVQVIASRTLGGAEGFFGRLCRGLGERGCEVHAVLREGSAVADALSDEVAHSSLPLRTVWDPLSRRELRREIERRAPDLVQTWMSRATRLTRAPRGVVHVARLGGYYTPSRFAHADALVVNSRGLADFLIGAGLPAHRVHLIGNFVEAAPVDAARCASVRASLPVPADAWLVLAVGRCVQVLARIPAQIDGRPVALLLLGDGPQREALQALARQLGVAPRVHFAGWQTDPAPFYALADLVVFPSRAPEALGNVILETWAHGRPLLTTASHGARELTRPGSDAWQVPCEDAAALAEGMGSLLGDADARAALAAGGRARLAGEFGREAVLGAYVGLYRQLLGA
jgi:glycosyltransferase involved in cell wall biosynthesis